MADRLLVLVPHEQMYAPHSVLCQARTMKDRWCSIPMGAMKAYLVEKLERCTRGRAVLSAQMAPTYVICDQICRQKYS